MGKTRNTPLDKLCQSSRRARERRGIKAACRPVYLAGSKTDHRGIIGSPLAEYACVTSAHVVAGLIGGDWEKATAERERRGKGTRDYVTSKTPANATGTKKRSVRFFSDSNNRWHPRHQIFERKGYSSYSLAPHPRPLYAPRLPLFVPHSQIIRDKVPFFLFLSPRWSP